MWRAWGGSSWRRSARPFWPVAGNLVAVGIVVVPSALPARPAVADRASATAASEPVVYFGNSTCPFATEPPVGIPQPTTPTAQTAQTASSPFPDCVDAVTSETPSGADARDLWTSAPFPSYQGSAGAAPAPVISPDGQAVAFAYGNTVVATQPGGRPPRVLFSASGLTAPSWAPNGGQVAVAYANPSPQGGILRASGGIEVANADGVGRQAIAQLSPAPSALAWSPIDGGEIAYLEPLPGGGNMAQSQLDVIRPDGTYPRVLFSCSEVDSATSCANAQRSIAGFAWSPTGASLAVALTSTVETCTAGENGAPGSCSSGQFEVFVLNADGSGVHQILSVPDSGGSLGTTAWSPNGQFLALSVQGQLTIVSPDGTGLRQLGPCSACDLSWSPDSASITFSQLHYPSGSSSSYVTRQVEVIPVSGGPAQAVAGSAPDGTGPAFATARPGCGTDRLGYWVLAGDGRVFAFGIAPGLRSSSPTGATGPAAGMTWTGNATSGYMVADSDGGVATFGTAQTSAPATGARPPGRVVGIAVDPADYRSYWLVGAGGQVIPYGDARSYGSVPRRLAAPVVGMAATPAGGGYWLVSARGGVFSFGDAKFFGSAPSHIGSPIVGMAPTPDGGGYWLVGSRGGVFSFGDAKFFGSATSRTGTPIVGMAPTPDGSGYWLVSATGGVFSFGRAPFLGRPRPGGYRAQAIVADPQIATCFP